MQKPLTWYLGTPGSALAAHMARQMPVLISFAATRPWLERSWVPSFSRLLLDSGAFSELNSGVCVDLNAYIEWVTRFPGADAWAGLDDIAGDWRRSLENYKAGGFPTFHDTDPEELLPELIAMSRERGSWLGIGLKPPRANRWWWLRKTLEQIPEDIHVHGWACGSYASLRRFDSIDSTNWFRDANKILTHSMTSHLTPAEALEIIVKRYQRVTPRRVGNDDQLTLNTDRKREEG